MTNKGLTNQAGDTLPDLRPEQFPLGSEKSRAAARALLMRRSDQIRSRIRVVVETIGAPAVEPPAYEGSEGETTECLLEDSGRLFKCTRRLGRDGLLIEMLEGSVGEMTEEQIQELLERFPIERYGRDGKPLPDKPETIFT